MRHNEEGQLLQSQTESSIEIQLNLESRNFEESLIEAVDQTFSKLGLPVKNAIYSFLETNYKLARNEIPGRVEAFAFAIEDLLGAGALLVEIEIMKNLGQKFSSFKVVKKDASLDFKNYVVAFKDYLDAR